MISDNIVIIEPFADGHRLQYVRRIVSELRIRNKSVDLMICRGAMQHPAYIQLMAACPDNLNVIQLDDNLFSNAHWSGIKEPLYTIIRHFCYYRSFKKIHKQIINKFECIFVPYLDYCDKMIGLFGSPFSDDAWAGLLMRPSFHYQEMGVLAPP